MNHKNTIGKNSKNILFSFFSNTAQIDTKLFLYIQIMGKRRSLKPGGRLEPSDDEEENEEVITQVIDQFKKASLI